MQSSPSRQSIKQRFGIVGDHPKLNAALDIAIQVAPTEVTVVIVGENGVGKDVFGSIIHQLSARRHKPFIAINCGAIPEGTIDSELFGHEKGSFTSAYEARRGYFEEVNGGQIFLDEIAEMPLHTQSRLLRILENGEYLRVGSSKVQKTDVRVVAATNKNLIEQIRGGKFREDLYFRLNTVTIYVPPLRERGQDIELLFRYFANEFGTRYGRSPIQLDDAARHQLHDYHWPGNVRELRNFVEKLTVLTRETLITANIIEQQLQPRDSKLPVLLNTPPVQEQMPPRTDNGSAFSSEMVLRMMYELKADLQDVKRALVLLQQSGYNMSAGAPVRSSDMPEVVYAPPVSPLPYREPTYPVVRREDRELDAPPTALEESLSIERKEKDLIARALSKYNHNRKKAATELGISERTLYRKIKSYGLDE